MRRRWLFLALGTAFAVAACSDQGQAPPTAPQFKQASTLDCNFNDVKSLLNYFSPPTLQTAQGYESLMESGGPQSTDARLNGFKIMDLIGTASRSASPPSTTVGSSLTKALTKCMFNAHDQDYTDLADTSGLDAVEFDKALSPSSGGVYYVVGKDYDLADGIPPVLKGTVGTDTLSKAAPGPATFTSPTTFTLGNWTDLLAGTANATLEDERALVYAFPVSTNPLDIVYEWGTIDPRTQFSPYALVSICDGTDPTLMVHETNAGVLAFSNANLCDIPDATGTATGFRSKFSNQSVTELLVDWLDDAHNPGIPSTWNGTSADSARPAAVTVSANTSIGFEPALRFCAYLTSSNNNGTPTELRSDVQQATECTNPPGGDTTAIRVLTQPLDPTHSKADFGDVWVTKTGTIMITATVNGGLSTTGTTSVQANVKPAKKEKE